MVTCKHAYETQPDGSEICFECDHVKPKSNTQIQRDFRVRRRAAGMIQVTAWIPASRKEDHKVFVKRLCEDEK